MPPSLAHLVVDPMPLHSAPRPAFLLHGLLNAGGSAVEVDFNPTLVLMQLGLVTVLMLCLKPLLFDPLLALFEQREKLVDGTLREARTLDDKAADMLRQREGEIEQTVKLAAQQRDALRAEAQKLEATEMATAKQEVDAILEEGRQKLRFEAAALNASLRGEAGNLARDVASRILGREVS